jgi:tetratricopeptide (TPR) repeat protein
MTVAAERIATQYRGEAEADDALATLISLAVHDGNAEDALRYLERMSAESPKRAAAEMAAGQSLWNQAISAAAASGDDAALAKRQQQAIELLESGLRRSMGSPATATTVAAALVVAQHLVNTGKPSRALELLEDPAIGPKTLADQGHALLQVNDLRQRVYLLAMLATVGTLSENGSTAETIDHALALLDKITGGTEGGTPPSQVASMYVMIARSLQEQIKAAPVNRRDAMVKAFAQLLERAVATTKELSVLNWAADSYVSLGTALQADNKSDEAAIPYLRQAVATYKEILKRADAGKFTVSAQERLLIDTRLAMALREQGEFEEAVDRFAAILTVQPNQVYVQMEAARTLERWGERGNHAAYLKAILGDRLDPKSQQNTIWGYGRIAKLIASKPDLRSLFFEARYAVAECRYQHALQLPEKERANWLAQAEQDVLLTARLYPDLGSNEQKQKFEQLLKQIQRSLGKQFTGLPT